jgi:hypothetical protein
MNQAKSEQISSYHPLTNRKDEREPKTDPNTNIIMVDSEVDEIINSERESNRGIWNSLIYRMRHLFFFFTTGGSSAATIAWRRCQYDHVE